MDPYARQRIENWAADFAVSDAARRFPPPVRDHAPIVLAEFLLRAAGPLDDLDEVSEADIRRGLVKGAASVQVPEGVQDHVPDLCGAFLEELERQGRIADGRILASFVRAARGAYDEAAGIIRTYRRPASKLSPNDPCPCGSGRKWKKCCQGM
jgi:hypothetical protein